MIYGESVNAAILQTGVITVRTDCDAGSKLLVWVSAVCPVRKIKQTRPFMCYRMDLLTRS